MVRLSKTEKDEIAKLYKCQRAAEEFELHEELDKGVEKLTLDINKQIKTAEEECLKLKKQKAYLINQAGYGTIVDAFRLETNAQLMKLWSGEVNSL